MELNFPLFAGIIAAMLHVIAGPDHLAAVTPFAIESKKKAWKVGLFWGVGHLLGMLFIGVLFLYPSTTSSVLTPTINLLHCSFAFIKIFK